MLDTKSCKPFKVRIYGVDYDRIPYGQGHSVPIDGMPDLCHDCGVEKGGYHHPGCDMETCPRCGGQIIYCNCIDLDDEATRRMAAEIE
jgi:hypothetical protein